MSLSTKETRAEGRASVSAETERGPKRIANLSSPILLWSLLPAGKMVFTTSAPFSVPREEGESMRFFIGAAVLSFALASAAPQFPSHVASLDRHRKLSRMTYHQKKEKLQNELSNLPVSQRLSNFRNAQKASNPSADPVSRYKTRSSPSDLKANPVPGQGQIPIYDQ